MKATMQEITNTETPEKEKPVFTKSDYLRLKETYKELSRKSRSDKYEMRAASRRSWNEGAAAQYESHISTRKARALHVFLSLVRGRTREQVEPVFSIYRIFSIVERDIAELCDAHGFEYEYDEHGRVWKITLPE